MTDKTAFERLYYKEIQLLSILERVSFNTALDVLYNEYKVAGNSANFKELLMSWELV